jgi:hypothetical protein
VNIFIQLVSPSRATSLPTQYLWKSEKLIPAYMTTVAIDPEKIDWSIDGLLDLHAFARHMEVRFVCDMVLDRIHWMYSAHTAMKKAYADVLLQHGKAGRKAGADFQMPLAPDLGFSLAAEDFEVEHLDLLALEEPLDVQAFTFITDVLHALGGAPDKEWVENAPEMVKDIFANAPHGSCITNASRAQFCAQYHHHAEPGECYTAFPTHSLSWYNHNLYTTSNRKELVKLSTGLSADVATAANSTPDMVAAEKMIMEMEMWLEEAKEMLERAKGAGTEEEKGPMVWEVKKMLRMAKVAWPGKVG